ncbi:MAG: hypothetical protein K6B28_05490, partial [Lachnospiraceae bacterium]|nr:hypothetical protein [Lachnospiraceae bacterium]
QLEKRGYKVKICNSIQVDFWKALFYRPKVIMMVGARTTESLKSISPFLFKHTHVYINMQEEQIAYSGEGDLNLFIPTGYAKDVYHLTRGSFAHDYLKMGEVSDDHIVWMKPVQFDLCNKKLSDYYYPKEHLAEQYGLDISKKWIMFASDFVITTLARDEEELKDLCKRTYSVYDRTWHAEKDAQALIAEWFDRFLTDHKDYIIIYRPHPDERIKHDFIDRLKEKHDNFHYIGDYSIKQWIGVIDVFITWFSTSVMESYYADVPCFALGNGAELEKKGIAIPLFDKDKYIMDYDVFEACMTETEANREKYFPLDMSMIERYYGKYDYEFASVKIADYVDSILKDKKKYDSMKIRLPFKEKFFDTSYRRNFIKTSVYNDLFMFLRPVLWYIIPWKRNSILKFSDELKRFDKKRLRETERKLYRILDKAGL